MYAIEGLRKVFEDGAAAVDGVTLAVAAGERVAVLGPSGAGKTTLFRLLNLTLRPTAGVIRLAGTDVAGFGGRALRAARARIGTVYQQHNLVGRLAVAHNVLAGHLGRWSALQAAVSLCAPGAAADAEAALARVGVADKLWARTDELSGGQQQRVAIARVLVQDPDVILADEPVSSVDPALAQALVTLLVECAARSGKTLLVNLHSVGLALDHFPRIVGMREGRVHFDLPPRAVTPRHLEGLYAGSAPAASPERGDAPARVLGCRPLEAGVDK